MTSLPGENVILKGWKKASINGGIEMETAGLLSLDPLMVLIQLLEVERRF